MSDRHDLHGAGRSRRNPARFLAPVFLIAVIAGTYVVVHNGINQINRTTSSTSRTTTQPHLTKTQRKYVKAKYYTVQSGDTLTQIAAKTGVSIDTLVALNRHMNPNSLQLGQRIRLRR
jgi:LysM repeat protein